MKKKKTVERLVRELNEWLKIPSNYTLYADSDQQLEKYLRGELLNPLTLFSRKSIWLGQSGAGEILVGNIEGWKKIHASLHCLAWNDRILHAMLEKKTARSIQIIRMVFVLLHAIAVKEDNIARYFGKRLLKGVIDNDMRMNDMALRPLYIFAIHLYALWQDISLDDSQKKVKLSGIYKEMIDSWCNADKFGLLITSACDYHIDQAFEDSENDTQDFVFPLYDLFPVEILAIQRIRIEHGLSIQLPSHPLLDTGLVVLPSDMTRIYDPLFDKSIEKLCREFAFSVDWSE